MLWVKDRCVNDLCVGDKVSEDTKRAAEVGGRRTEADGSAQQKTRTPHKDVGNGKECQLVQESSSAKNAILWLSSRSYVRELADCSVSV